MKGGMATGGDEKEEAGTPPPPRPLLSRTRESMREPMGLDKHGTPPKSPKSWRRPNYLPSNPLVTSLLTDLYQITMAYAYWKNGRQNEHSVFDLFFRKNPFKGEYCIFGGLDECLRFINSFSFTRAQIGKLKKCFPNGEEVEEGFWEYLLSIDCSEIKVRAQREGSMVFPRVPLLRIEGPLGVAQLLETTLLNTVNFASLLTTNAARHRHAAGPDKIMLEFGLRRAQGPDGGISASRYAYMGGFDGTSNVLAGCMFGIKIKGTHAHSFVQSYRSLSVIKDTTIRSSTGEKVEFVEMVQEKLKAMGDGVKHTNEGELAAFIAYAQAYPSGFLALVDTYDTLVSGCINYVAVALALHELGYTPNGIRLDSGDLAYLSVEVRKLFRKYDAMFKVDVLAKGTIVASNDINENVLYALNEQGHDIDAFGIGTHLVTCKAQPALGCVYKLVSIEGEPRIKLSMDIVKLTIPGQKRSYRLYNKEDVPWCDVMVEEGSEDTPEVGKSVLVRHPFDEKHRARFTPSRVEELDILVWDGGLQVEPETLDTMKKRCHSQIAAFRQDHIRKLNPTPYKVSVNSDLHLKIKELWERERPVQELC